MEYKLWLNGGTLRDRLLGIESNDIDYTVVIENREDYDNEVIAFSAFQEQLKREGFEIFLSKVNCLTVKAKFPPNHKFSGVVDFVIARGEKYTAGSRTPVTFLSGIEDDIMRRDFTCNALMEDEDWNLMDIVGGVEAIRTKTLDTPLDPVKSFRDDPLRILRAMRFCITKGFTLHRDVKNAIREMSIHDLEVVSFERISMELNKCFKYDTVKTIKYLNFFEKDLGYPIINYVFGGYSDLYIQLTNKKR